MNTSISEVELTLSILPSMPFMVLIPRAISIGSTPSTLAADAAARVFEKLGFTVLPSKANFLFARHAQLPGADYYSELKKRGVLVRHFTKPEIEDFCRITIGPREQMDILLDATRQILKERGWNL